ncbi:alpha/beta hydrolase [uncultured Sphingomonas sp.]|uniref:alpha/beta hydrolase n=1 Tax=uncultured Sphingomonas sp. TaxID=158754 RepID=UPI002600CD66|nr:alpha/beta hydrolase [uncultured Sphingomonas sp.]
MLDRRGAIVAALGAGITGVAVAQTPPPGLNAGRTQHRDPTETIDLWPKGAPNAPATLPVEAVVERSGANGVGDREVHGIARPRMVVFRPEHPNGCAALVTPGGGYRYIVIDKEGYEVARWLTARGWTVFVLFYRLPGEGWSDRANVPLADAQRAMRLIRSRAKDYGVRADRVAAMGFSAGGHLCADLATRFGASVYQPVDAADGLSARPDIAAPIYPVQSMTLPIAHAGSRELLLGPDATPAMERAHSPADTLTAEAPPLFLAHAEDDGAVPVGNSLLLRAAARAAGIKVETHLFETGGHGFGLRAAKGKPAEVWPDLFVRWAATHGFAG